MIYTQHHSVHRNKSNRKILRNIRYCFDVDVSEVLCVSVWSSIGLFELTLLIDCEVHSCNSVCRMRPCNLATI